MIKALVEFKKAIATALLKALANPLVIHQVRLTQPLQGWGRSLAIVLQPLMLKPFH